MESVKEGFLGQRIIVLPKKIVSTIKKNQLIDKLYFTDIGFFPNASHHHVERKNGSRQHILIYCYKGEGIITFEDKTIGLSANTYYIIPPGVAHEYYARDTNPWSIYWIHFTGSQAELLYTKFWLQYTNCAPLLALEERRISLFDHFMDILEGGYSESNIEYVNISLWQLLSSFLYENFFGEENKHLSEKNTIEEAIDFMKKSLDMPLRIEELAAKFSYSPSHFYTLFKKRTGYSPIHYFNHLKIQKACQYLSFTNMSVKEISFTLGFNDPLYFSRLFKKTMNMPPLRYRKEYSH
jgi:AraC family transcriptional regulator, arabinose operon regulatory protein